MTTRRRTQVGQTVESLEGRLLLYTPLFADQQTLTTGLPAANVTQTATADLNADHKTDLIVLQPNAVGILLGHGDGTFAAAAQLPLVAHFDTEAMTVADINGDGHLDIAVAGFNDVANTYSIDIYHGTGSGTFASPQIVPNTTGVNSLVAADMNDDNRVDLVYARDSVQVQLQNSDGSFAAAISSPASGNAQGIAVGDLNNDSIPDVVTAGSIHGTNNNVDVLLGNGNGTFQAPTTYTPSSTGTTGVVLADMLNNGFDDIVSYNNGQPTGVADASDFDVFINHGNGTFAPSAGFGVSADDFAVADVSNDGLPDVVTSFAGRMTVFVSNGDGTFQEPLQFTAGSATNDVTGVQTADFNGDGHVDALFLSNDGTAITELLNTGSTAFELHPVSLTVSGPTDAVRSSDPVQFVVSVAPLTNDLPVITGSVTLSDNGVVVSTVNVSSVVDGSSTATFNLPAVPAGVHTFDYAYSGDSNYETQTTSQTIISTPDIGGGGGGGGGSATPTLGAVALPNTIVAGQKVKDKIPVNVTAAGAAIKGKVTVQLVANTTNTLDGNEVAISQLSRNVSLKLGKKSVFAFNNKPLPANLPAGNYFLLANVTYPGGSSVVATTQTVAVAAPIVTLALAVPAIKPTTIALNKVGVFSVQVTNTGNIDAKGVLMLILSASPDGTAAGALLTTVKKGLVIKAGKTATVQVHLKHTAAMTAGTYFPVITATLNNASATVVGAMPFTLI